MRVRKEGLGAILVIAPLILITYLQSLVTNSFCLFKISIGLPCPGCGSIRSFLALCRGDFLESLHFHPLILLSLGIIIYFTVKYAFKIEMLSKKMEKWLCVICILLYTIVFVVRLWLYFPHTEPMIPFKNAVWYLILQMGD